MGRPPCCDKSNVKRGLWTEEEDLKLIAYTNTHGIGNWTTVPKKAGLKRCGKSCRLRWTNYLRPNLKHESFTPQEEEMIVALHATIGSRWSMIAYHLPGRTDNDIKNHWNTKLSKKLLQQGIDPITHHPISHIISSITHLSTPTPTPILPPYQPPPPINPTVSNNNSNSSNSSNNNAHITSLNRDLKNIFLTKPSPSFSHQELNNIHSFTTVTTCASSSNEASSNSATDNLLVRQLQQQEDIKWSDFLVDDVFGNPYGSQSLSSDCNQYNQKVIDSWQEGGDEHGGNITTTTTTGKGKGKVQVMEEAEVSSSVSGSFVDAILDQDREMMMLFPEFFSDPDGLN